ncbi:hypothetical protein BKA70DRAFT_1260374 [Coprinopsis sp. MPI-PUGE-AT-0042]|nr:hypothetical protein BKA70DRAFT_1260374 [Coprinopsis sp. MPI-PUGE-AT-0042]
MTIIETTEPLSKELCDELSAVCRGSVILYDDSDFANYITIFNGNIEARAKAVVCPLDATDVSLVLTFCLKHDLSPSVKAGGYGTAGCAVGGDIVIDLSKIMDIDIERPAADGSFTSLRDVASANSKGKAAVDQSRASNGKRRREEDDNLRVFDDASKSVASLLSGPLLSEHTGRSVSIPSSDERPSNRRRLDPESMPAIAGRQISQESTATSGSSNSDGRLDSMSSSGSGNVSGTSTMATSPSPAPDHSPSAPNPSSSLAVPGAASTSSHTSITPEESPFDYLDGPTDFSAPAPPSTVQAAYNPHAMMHSWGSGSNSLLSGFGQEPIDTATPAQAEAIYPHVFVTFGAGMRQKEIDNYTAAQKVEARYITGHGDGIPYHVPFAAHPVGSSVMLLGGFGFLSRLHGLSCDNLVEAEMVLADGRVVVVSENEHSDLWWALRGAGTALGVVTRYKAKAYPVPVVFAGNLIYRFNKATAPSLIKHFRDCVKGAPRELYANVLLTAGPQGKDSLVVIQMCYVGPREKGQEYLTAISSWTGERCLLNEVDEKSFLHQQDSVAQVLRGKAGRQWFIRSALISSLPDDIIHETVLHFADTPVGCTWLFELTGGAVAEFDNGVIPKSQREATFTIAALHQWEMNANDDRCIDSAEEWIAHTLKPVHVGGPYPSFIGRHEKPERVKASYGSNWDRLVEIKKLYDPGNVFRNSFWPLNESGETVDPRSHEPRTPSHLDAWETASI